jgi:hypothetical protein
MPMKMPLNVAMPSRNSISPQASACGMTIGEEEEDRRKEEE